MIVAVPVNGLWRAVENWPRRKVIRRRVERAVEKLWGPQGDQPSKCSQKEVMVASKSGFDCRIFCTVSTA